MIALKSPSILETPNKMFTAEIMSGICSPNHLVGGGGGRVRGNVGTHGRRRTMLTLGDE